MYIVSFDPGETTGVVVGNWVADREFGIVHAEEIFWTERFVRPEIILSSWMPEYIVIESFRLYPHAARTQIGKDFPSAQVIGTIETYANMLGLLDRVHKQPASVRSSVQIEPKHKVMLESSVHVADAYKHLRYFIIVNLPKLERSQK